jgi:Cu/Ag efflux protein CusF
MSKGGLEMLKGATAGLAAALAFAGAARADEKPVATAGTGHKTVAEGITPEVTATIEAIDRTARKITLKGRDGVSETVTAGPEVKRFDELKVGDTVTFRYHESVVYKIRKAGEAAPPDAGQAVLSSQGPKPGGTAYQQQTATVKIKAIDAKAPSVTVLTPDGRTVSFKVDDKEALGKVKVGDTVDVTYTEALMISVR